MRLVLLHYHILKNGGSTIEEILRRSLPETFASFDHPHRDAEIRPAELVEFLNEHPTVNAFSSHQIFYPVPRAPGFLFFDLCFLRDPFDRIRSIYDYFRGKPADDDPIRMLAHGNTLRDFVGRLIEEMPWAVNDVQVNLLAHGLVNDTPRGFEDLETATRRMRETSFLGVVNCFEESLVAGEYAMRTVFPALDCAQERVNDSARPGSTMEQRLERFKTDLGDDVFSELARLNAMDLELLRRARAEVRRRFENTPGAGERLCEIRGLAKARVPERKGDREKTPPVASEKPGAFTKFKRRVRFLADVRNSKKFRKLFDADYYARTYPDAAANPLWHFVTQGAFEGRNPNRLFDTNFYLSQCASAPETNALSHYLKHGGRPHPLFDPEYYTRRYPDVAQAGTNPLLHYLLHGAAEGRKPNPWFAPDFYFAGCPEAREAANPLLHFLEYAAANPHPLFDCDSYWRAHPEIAENPLAHFLKHPPDAENVEVRLTIDEVEASAAIESDGKICCAPHLRRFFDCVRYDQIIR